MRGGAVNTGAGSEPKRTEDLLDIEQAAYKVNLDLLQSSIRFELLGYSIVSIPFYSSILYYGIILYYVPLVSLPPGVFRNAVIFSGLTSNATCDMRCDGDQPFQVLPFILLGLGVDDSFVICNAFGRTDPRKSLPERMKEGLGTSGQSLPVTRRVTHRLGQAAHEPFRVNPFW